MVIKTLKKTFCFYVFGILPCLLAGVSSHAQPSTIGPSVLGTYVMVDGITSSTATLAKELDQARAAGIGIVRITFDAWGLVETSSGVFNWTQLDKIVNLITGTYGMDMLFTTPISAPWNIPPGTVCPASDPTFTNVQVGCTHFPTNNMGLVYRFSNKVAERYRGKIKYYEAWNEPDASFFWKAVRPPDVNEYFAYLKSVYQGIKAADPSAVVLMGGLAFPEDNAWINALMALGAANYMDVMNVHYYQLADQLSVITNNIKKVQSDYGISKPVWITETSRTGAQFPTSDRVLEERKKSVFLMEMFPEAFGGIYSKVFWHTLRNPVGYDFALADTAGNPFPAYTMFRKFSEHFSGTSFVSQVSTGPLYGWRYQSPTKDVYMFYSGSGTRPILPALANLPNYALVTDADGNEVMRNSTDIFAMTVGKDPIFLSALPENDSVAPVFNANMTMESLSPTSIHVSWSPATDNVTVAGYELDLAKNPNFVNCVPGYQAKKFLDSVSTVAEGLQPRSLYYGRVCAYDAAGNKSYSTPLYVMTPSSEPGLSKENILSKREVLAPMTAGPEPVVFGPEARTVEIRTMRGTSIFSGNGDGNRPLIWTGRDGGGRVVESGAYLATIRDAENKTHYQVIVVAK